MTPGRNDMRTSLLALCAGLALTGSTVVFTQEAASSSVEKAFKTGGSVRFDLSAGDYDIRGTAAESISIHWRTRKPGDARKVRASAEVRGTHAVVRVSGPHDGLHVRIDVPRRSDLEVDLSAGDLSVRSVEGNESLTMWAGDVSIEAGQANQYRRVDASVRFGDLDARPFGVVKEGIFRSFSWTGTGKYTLRAKLFAGDLTFLR